MKRLNSLKLFKAIKNDQQIVNVTWDGKRVPLDNETLRQLPVWIGDELANSMNLELEAQECTEFYDR